MLVAMNKECKIVMYLLGHFIFCWQPHLNVSQMCVWEKNYDGTTVNSGMKERELYLF
jgi:hypothetical protein